MAVGDQTIERRPTCGKNLVAKESLYGVTLHEPQSGKKHCCQGRSRCPGPAFCDDKDCDYCNAL